MSFYFKGLSFKVKPARTKLTFFKPIVIPSCNNCIYNNKGTCKLFKNLISNNIEVEECRSNIEVEECRSNIEVEECRSNIKLCGPSGKYFKPNSIFI